MEKIKGTYTLAFYNHPKITEWLNKCPWLTHWSGNGNGMLARFSQFEASHFNDPKFELKRDKEGRPYRVIEGENYVRIPTVELVRESMGTFNQVNVQIELHQSSLSDDILDMKVLFYIHRASNEYEVVFNGYVKSFEEFKTALRLLGIEESKIDFKL